MKPRLVAVAGPLNGNAFHLARTEVSIGRDPSNPICIDSRSVSRRHCVIQGANSQLVIRDLDSLNGTFVNDVPIKERVLNKADQIAIGDSVFVLVVDDEDETAASQVHIQPDDTTIVNLDVVRLAPEESIYLPKDSPPSAALRSARAAKNLNTLLSFSTSVSSIRTIDELQKQVLTSIVEIVPAEYAAFLELGADESEIKSLCGWDRETGVGALVKTSHTIVSQVIETRSAVLAKGIAPGKSFGAAESLANLQVRSVLCVPMQAMGKLLGVIYLATRNQDRQFDEDHLQLITAICSVAAVAVHNTHQMEFLIGENQRLQARD